LHGKRLGWQLSRLYGDPLPDPATLASIQATDNVYETDKSERLRT
jgi:hypothetical protein